MPQLQRQRATTTNRFSRIIATLAVSAVLVTSGAVTATAATLPQPIPTPAIETAFEIDGNMSGANDWDGIAATPYGPYTTASGNASTGILDNTSGNDGCTGSDASAFPGSQTINTNLSAVDAPDTLRASVGGDVIVMHAHDPERLRARIQERFACDPVVVDGTLRIERPLGHEFVREVAAAFPGEMRSISFGQPTLEDVFVQRTGHRFDGDGNDDRVSPP